MAARSELLDASLLRLEQDPSELLSLAAQWEDEELFEEDLKRRFEERLVKLPMRNQLETVRAFRPLREEVSRRLKEWSNEFNEWLTEAAGEISRPQTERLRRLFKEIEVAPQSSWYRQCPSVRVKTKFLMAVANLLRALECPFLKPFLESHLEIKSLAESVAKRLFVLPEMGNILESWHDGRLACYNAALSLAAKLAAEKMKDELQVSLVSAVKRAVSDDKSKEPKGALQIELRDWPMSACPLARAFLDFLRSHAQDLGEISHSLRDCPPNVLRPQTLRDLLSRLDAFDLGASTVKLRFEAVAALAYKAVGTKPKAGAAPPKAPPDVSHMSRLILRGLRAGDEDWRQAWTQFCWQRNISSRLSRDCSLPADVLAAFLEAQASQLQQAPWAREASRERRSSSESSVSRRRHKRRREKYRDFYGGMPGMPGMRPEVMMMRAQMMGVSMVMNSPLAMMGMGNPMMSMPRRSRSPKRGKDSVKDSKPLARVAAAARKQQQESTIDMDDL